MALTQDVLDQMVSYRPKLVGLLRRKGQSLEGAEDIAQEAILRTLAKEHVQYVPALLGSTALNILRSQQTHDAAPTTGAARCAGFEDGNSYDRFFDALRSERADQFAELQKRELLDVVAKLKPVYQRDFHLYCMGHSFVEMAQITGQTEVTHKLRFHRITAKIVELMQPPQRPEAKGKQKTLAATAG